MLLELRDINKTYDNDGLPAPVLFDINLDVEEGEYVSIMGPSGSGKSTLMNIIGCLDVPTSGSYIIKGEHLDGKTDNELADLRNRTIGFVFQNFNLLPRESALANVALPLLYAGVGRAERMKLAREALINVGLGDRTGYTPTQLSGGQKQRVAIARAMILKPDLLLADEPTGALDSASGQQIMDIFDELNRNGTTIIMITHEKEIADRAKRSLYIRDGRLYSCDGGEQLSGESSTETTPHSDPVSADTMCRPSGEVSVPGESSTETATQSDPVSADTLCRPSGEASVPGESSTETAPQSDPVSADTMCRPSGEASAMEGGAL